MDEGYLISGGMGPAILLAASPVEKILPGRYPHGIVQKVLFAKFAQHPVSASRGDPVFIAAGRHRCFSASAKANRPALRAF